MALLDEESFRKTFGKKMLCVSDDEEPPVPFWSYLEEIPVQDFQGYDCSEGNVQWVWRDEAGHFEHVLIDTKEDKDVFMVVVLDLSTKQVFGHRLLDLKREYGLRGSQ